MKKIYFVIAAVAMMMAGREKQAENEKVVDGINSFELNIQGFSDASGAKTSWDDDGLWWDEGDELAINGVKFVVSRIEEDGKWKWIATSGTQVRPDEGKYYVAYPYNGSGATYDQQNHTYGRVLVGGARENEEKEWVPLAAVTTSNSITLYPCCAVIKNAYSVSFWKDGEKNTPGIIDGCVYTEAVINIEDTELSDGEPMSIEGGVMELTDIDYDNCIIIPMKSDSVTAYLDVDGSVTTNEVTLKKGHIYVIGAKNSL